jgi:three-Cys-motif partner protein
MSQSPRSQKFGGPWSLQKLDAVQDYLQAYSTLMQNQPTPERPFKRIYIDAFAGSGSFSFDEESPPTLWDDAKSREEHKGSALRAIGIKPPFDQLWFIDKSEANIEALRSAIGPDSRVRFLTGDANEEIARICRQLNWSNYRGVIFLDPFGTSVEWSTLEIIQRTHALDLWYLFPMAGLYRNAPRQRTALTKDKRQTVTRLLGYDGWVGEFYTHSTSKQTSLLSDPANNEQRELDISDMERIVRTRLETIFPHVEAPLRLGPGNTILYSLFFAVSNPKPQVTRLASRIAQHILKKSGTDTHPKSGRPTRVRP